MSHLKPLTLTLNYDPRMLPKDLDPTTSEGKARIRQCIVDNLCRGHAHDPDVAQSLTSEGGELSALELLLLDVEAD